MTHELHRSHKKHRNVLYSLVVLLVVIQIITFLMLSIQISKLDVKIGVEAEQISAENRQFTTDLLNTYNTIYQGNFQEISAILIQQREDFEQDVKMLESTSQKDFSEVVEQSIRGVVAVSTPVSIGSGFFVHKGGYIVTNHHVVAGNEENINVITYTNEVLKAEVIGIDVTRDLVLLKVEGNYPALLLAKKDELQVGRKVIAIGNPLGLSFTVTEGIISALDRQGPSGLAEYVQTDVSLNPGNSGGPLIDTQGKVVGINNFKIAGTESLGFALESPIIRQQINAMAGMELIE
jgi:S1-C subfamily serine protease